MDKKKQYTKTIMLAKYKPCPPPAQFDRAAMQTLDIYSEPTLEPISLKMANFAMEMLYIQKPRGHMKPAAVEHKKEDIKEVIIPEKIAVFSFVASFVGIDPKLDTWYYSDKREHNVPYRGPVSSENMDKLWREEKLSLVHIGVYSNDICLLNPKTGEYTKKELKMDQFVPMEILLDHTIFNKVKARPGAPVQPKVEAKVEEVKKAPEPAVVPQPKAEEIKKAVPVSVKTTKVEEKKIESAPVPVPAPQDKKTTSPEKKPAEAAATAKKKEAKTKKESAKKLSKEEKAKEIATSEQEGFTIVESKKKAKGKKTPSKIEQEEEEENVVSAAAPQVVPQQESKVVPAQQSSPAKAEEGSSSEEEGDFEYIPSKAKAKRMKKKKKAGKAVPAVPAAAPEPDIESAEIVPAPAVVPVSAIKETAPKKASEPEKVKPAQKAEEKKVEESQAKVSPPAQSKKKKGKKGGAVDPSLLGLYLDKPKKETEEPEAWGTAPIEVKKVVPLEDLMKEETVKAQSKGKAKSPAKKK